jgi:hypothetical protein
VSTSDGSIQGVTKIVDHGPDSARWNLVILGDGYQSGQLTTYAADALALVNKLQATAPFDKLWPAINVHRVDVSSTDSGAADPVACGGTGATPKTYFDATFCGDGQIQRLLTVNTSTARSVATAQVPQVHMSIVIVNSTIYGGSGGPVAVFSKAANAVEIAIHEMGHTGFGLADEYEYFAGCFSGETGHDSYTGTEPAQPNVTANANRATIKWSSLIAGGTAVPTTSNANCAQCDTQSSPVPANTVGAFEGARYFHCGLYRPQFDCRMRKLGDPFCAVCEEVIRSTLSPFVTGQLLSYGDAGTEGNVSHPVVVGFSGWSDFKFLFAGRNVAEENRIYAVNQDGQLLSYGDAGTEGNVSHPVVVGFGGWLDFKFLFAGRNVAGEDRIYAVNQDGQLLSYGDAGTEGNVSHPVVVGFGGWSDFKFLFAGRNVAEENRIYAVVA